MGVLWYTYSMMDWLENYFCVALDKTQGNMIYYQYKLKKTKGEKYKMIDNYIEKLNLLIKIKDECKKKYEEAKQEIENFPKNISSDEISQDDRLKLCKFLYWNNPGIPVNIMIKELLGLKFHEITNYLKNDYNDIKCEKCSELVIFKSKQNYKDFIKYNKGLCNKCEEIERKNKIEYDLKHNAELLLEYNKKVNILKSMNYKDYLKTEHWMKIRIKSLNNAKYSCQICNNKKCQLDVHHKTYERRGEEKYNDLIVLCRDCHSLFHSQGKIIN